MSDARALEDDRLMRRALELARAGANGHGASPIGCVIVHEGRIVAEAHDEAGGRHDPTAHAEIVAMRRACEARDRDGLRGATLCSTQQPCGMCSMAAIWASITRIVDGAARGDVHRMYSEDRNIGVGDIVDDAWRDDPRVRGGVLAAACAALLSGPDDAPPAEEQANV